MLPIHPASAQATEMIRQVFGPQAMTVHIECGETSGGDVTALVVYGADGALLAPLYDVLMTTTLPQMYDGRGEEVIIDGLATPAHSQAAYHRALDSERAQTLSLALLHEQEPAGFAEALLALPLTEGPQLFRLPPRVQA